MLSFERDQCWLSDKCIISTHLKVLHSEVNSVSLPVGNLEIARPCRTSANYNSIILSPEIVDIDVLADMCVGNERLTYSLVPTPRKLNCVTHNALRLHKIQSTLNNGFVEFHAVI